MEEGWNAFKVLTGKPKLKRLLGKSCRRSEDSIKADLKEIPICQYEEFDCFSL